MLDRATIERLSQDPSKNAPLLNVALAEEGHAKALLSLAKCTSLGPEALSVIAERILNDGPNVGRDPEAKPDEPFGPIADELDRHLITRENAPDFVRDQVADRHAADPFFVLAAACHPNATLRAIERAADFPAASPAHDRLWIPLMNTDCIPPLIAEEWAQDRSPYRRETVARISQNKALLSALASDRDRRVRRAVASNRAAGELRTQLAATDPAVEVRARAAGALSAHEGVPEGGNIVETAKFAAALRAMRSLGVLAPDVRTALSSAGAALDEEGATLAAQVLARHEVIALLDHVVAAGAKSPLARGFSAGLALRTPPSNENAEAEDADGELVGIVYEAVKPLARLTEGTPSFTGKAKLSWWMANGLMTCTHVSIDTIAEQAIRGALVSNRPVLAHASATKPELVRALFDATASRDGVPHALLTLAWSDSAVSDKEVIDLAGRIARPKKRSEDLPEDEVDLDPLVRSLPVLERAVLTATLRANVSPRAALTAIGLDSRRVRYVVSAMPQWKGRLTGAKLARVLRQNAGALTAAHSETRARASTVEPWTQRQMSEVELAVAIAIGHITGAEVASRLASGRQVIDDGISLSAGILARASIEGATAVAPVIEWASKNRGSVPAALALWLLVEAIDRVRVPSLIAASIDQLATSKGAVPASVSDALTALELRKPGRLLGIGPQSPRGRATLASAIARAYRALGGMRDERQDS
ncbi:MAG: hypothetical protein IPK82_40770 [Polyangiaceae bacterium]|nr:hypothetical protein [Polyangiaceae bacterium]